MSARPVHVARRRSRKNRPGARARRERRLAADSTARLQSGVYWYDPSSFEVTIDGVKLVGGVDYATRVIKP